MAEFYDREKLYQEVWNEPMTEVCKKYGISDVALAKVCKKLQVPRPPMGYWAKKAAGKKVEKSKLYKFDRAPKIQIREQQDEKTHLAAQAFEQAEELVRKWIN